MNTKLELRTVRFIFLAGTVALTGQALCAEDIVKRATNPIGDIVQVQIQHQHGSNIYDLDGNSDTSIVQPVIPFDLPWESVPSMVTRTTIPYVSTADLPGSGSVEGLGDTVVLTILRDDSYLTVSVTLQALR